MDMVTDPSATWTFGRGRIAGQYADVWDPRLPNGLGARFDTNGAFETFLDRGIDEAVFGSAVRGEYSAR